MSTFGYTSETAPPGLRDAYKALEADPNADYGTILPAFDPARRDSSDLMAGIAAPAPVPGFRVTEPEPARDESRPLWPVGTPYRFFQREQVY
jgi:hypothetical protein